MRRDAAVLRPQLIGPAAERLTNEVAGPVGYIIKNALTYEIIQWSGRRQDRITHSPISRASGYLQMTTEDCWRMTVHVCSSQLVTSDRVRLASSQNRTSLVCHARHTFTPAAYSSSWKVCRRWQMVWAEHGSPHHLHFAHTSLQSVQMYSEMRRTMVSRIAFGLSHISFLSLKASGSCERPRVQQTVHAAEGSDSRII